MGASLAGAVREGGRRIAHVSGQALGGGCEGLPRRPMMPPRKIPMTINQAAK
jgi:hypothetical protein